MTMSEQNECETIIVSADAPLGPTGPTRSAGNTGASDGSCNGVQGAQGCTADRLGRGRQRRGSIVLPVQPHMDLRRNAPCPCGSGKKAKKCCLRRLAALSGLPPVVRTQALVAGILGHWPTIEPPRPVPAAVQQRFNDLAAQQAAAKVQEKKNNEIAIESGAASKRRHNRTHQFRHFHPGSTRCDTDHDGRLSGCDG